MLVFLFRLCFKNCPSPTLQRQGILAFLDILKCIASRSETFRVPNRDEIQIRVSPKLDPSF